MIVSKTRKWGGSLGIRIPNDVVRDLQLREDEEVEIEITRRENPLKELFGSGRKNKITREEFVKTRRLFEEKI